MNNDMIENTLKGLRLIHGEAEGLKDSVSAAVVAANGDRDELEPLTTKVLFGFLCLVVYADELGAVPWHTGIELGLSPVPEHWPEFATYALGGARDNRHGLTQSEVIGYATGAGIALLEAIAEHKGEHRTPGWVAGEIRKRIEGDRATPRIIHPEAVTRVLDEAHDDAELRQWRWSVAVGFKDAITDAKDAIIIAVDRDPTVGEAAVIRLVYALAETAWAAINCLHDQVVYPSNVLSRSIVETEMLLFRFDTDPGSWDRWAVSDREQREAEFSAAAIYKDPATEYRRVDYSTHSEHGGHPTPVGVSVLDHVLMPAEGVTERVVDRLLSHLTIHLHRCTVLVYRVAESIAALRGASIDRTKVDEVLSAWDRYERTDPLISLSSHEAIPDRTEAKLRKQR